MSVPHPGPPQVAAEPSARARPSLAQRAGALLADQFGSPRTWLRWAAERASLRSAGLRWIVLLAGLGALLCAWYTPGERSNLARHAQVTMSSQGADPPQHFRDPGDPARLVDGKADRDFDALTATELHPWVQLDLGVRAALTRVVVVGRWDCCWGAHALPLVLEVSDDGQEYRQVRRRTLPFTQSKPWRARFNGQLARYLRIRSEADVPSEIVLSEIEVYGEPSPDTAGSGPR